MNKLLPSLLLTFVLTMPFTPFAQGGCVDDSCLAAVPDGPPDASACGQIVDASTATFNATSGAACARGVIQWQTLPYGLVVVMVYKPNAACFACSTQVFPAPGWTCTVPTAYGAASPITVTCTPPNSKTVYDCTTLRVFVNAQDSTGFSVEDGKATCGTVSASCEAVWGTNRETCTKSTPAVPRQHPPLECSLTLWNAYDVASATAMCFNR